MDEFANIDLSICPLDNNTIDRIITAVVNKHSFLKDVLGIIISRQFFYVKDLLNIKHTENHYTLKFIDDTFSYWLVFIKHPINIAPLMRDLTEYKSFVINDFDILTDERKSSRVAVITSFDYLY